MPTEVTPAPFRYLQQFPIALEHPRNFPTRTSTSLPHLTPALSHASESSSASMPTMGWSSVPPTGPARMADCMPNNVLPNGVRNPWAPYAGEMYRPASEKADRMALGQLGFHGPPSVAFGYGVGRSAIAPPSLIGRTHPGQMPGARRIDDGWDGSQGRAHVSHLPDPTSTAGRLGHTPNVNFHTASASNWGYAPSSFNSHVRMSPSSAYVFPPSVQQSLPPHSRRGSVSVPIRPACPTCSEPGRSRRVSFSTPLDGQPKTQHSPATGSPLRSVLRLHDAEGRRGEEGLRRKISSASRKSRDVSRPRGHSECLACA